MPALSKTVNRRFAYPLSSMKTCHQPRSLSEHVMHVLRTRLRLPVTLLMLACNLLWTLQSRADIIVKSNSGANTLLSLPALLPTAHFMQNSALTSADTLLFNNTVTGATTFRVANVTNTTLSLGGLSVLNPGGAITLQNSDNQNQTLSLGAAGIDLSRATQNLTLSSATGGTLTLSTSAAQDWLVGMQRTLTISSPIVLNHAVNVSFTGAQAGSTFGSVVLGSTTAGISGAGNLNVEGAPGALGGTVTLLGNNSSWTGALTVSRGAQVNLDQSAASQNKLRDSAALTLNRGRINLQGTGGGTEVVGSLALGQGLSQITRSAGTGVLAMNAITRTAGGGLNFGAAGIATTDTSNASSGILGTWAVVGFNDWAVSAASAADTAVNAFTGYTTQNALASWTNPAQHILMNASGTANAGADRTISSLKIAHTTATTAVTADVGAGFKLTLNDGANGGGILRNQNATTTILGGFLTAGANDAVADTLHLWNSQNTMIIRNVIQDNGGAALTLFSGGAGTVQLEGANTYSGPTIIANGTLQLGGNAAASDTATLGTGAVINDGTLSINKTTAAAGANATVANSISGTGIVTLQRGATLFTGTNTYLGDTNVLASTTFRVGSATALSGVGRFLLNSSSSALDLNGFSGTIAALRGDQGSASVALGNGTLTLSGNDDARSGSSNLLLSSNPQAYQGIISGAGNLVKSGSYTQVLNGSGALSFTGTTTVTNGVLQTSKAMATTQVTVNGGTFVAAANNVLADTAQVVVGGSGTYQINNGISDTIGSLTGSLNGRLAMVSGASNATLTLAANDGSTRQFDGVLTMTTASGTGLGSVVKSGNHTWVLGGGNAYNGSTTINAGVLRVSAGALVEVLPDLTALTLANAAGATFDLNGRSETIGSLAGGGASGGDVLLGSGTLRFGGNQQTTVFSGEISGTGDLIKQGGGGFTLNGVNTFTGDLVVRGGSVTLAGGSALADTAGLRLEGRGTSLTLSASETLGALTTARNTVINLGSGITLTSSEGASVTTAQNASGDTDTRVLRLQDSNGAADLKPGMRVTGANIPADTYIVQVLSGNQILINRTVGANFINQSVSFGTVGALHGEMAGAGNWTKTGTGTVVMTGANSLTGTITLAEGSLQVGGVNVGGRNIVQDVFHNDSTLAFSPSNAVSLNFAANVLNLTPFERIGNLTGGSNSAVINLTGGVSSALLAVGGTDVPASSFTGSIRGDANAFLVKEGTGQWTWTSNDANTLAGVIRAEAGSLVINGSEGVHASARLMLSNRAGARIALDTSVNEVVGQLLGGGFGATGTFPNGINGALLGNYIGGTGGEISLSRELYLSSSVANAVYAYGGAITGAGSLIKQGQNVLELRGSSSYAGETRIQSATTATPDNTNNTLRLGAFGSSSGVGTPGAGGYGSLPSNTRLQLDAGNSPTGTNRNVTFDLNGATQTLGTLASSGLLGSKTVVMRGGTLNINTTASTPTGLSSEFDGVLSGRGTINVLATLGVDGWTLSGDSNATQTGSLNISGGSVRLNRTAGTLGDTVHVNVASPGALRVMQTDTIGSLSGNGQVTLDTGAQLVLSLGPKGSIYDNAWSGTLTGTGGLTLASGGSLRVTGNQSYTGATTLQSGSALFLDYSDAGATNLIPGTLALNGGNIYMNGANAGETVNTATLANGASIIKTQTALPAARLAISTLNRSAGGVIEIHGASVAVGATNGGVVSGAMLGGYATYHAVGGNGAPVVSWAVLNGAGNPVTAFNGYVDTFGAGLHTDVTTDNSVLDAISGDIGSLRFNSPGNINLFIGGEGNLPTSIQSGGILVTPGVGAYDVKISGQGGGETLSGGHGGAFGVLNELIVHQHNTRGSLTIDAQIVNESPGTRFTKTGQGRLILTQNNLYSGQTSIFGGVLQLGDGSLDDTGRFGTLGSGAQDVQNYGYLVFSRYDNDLDIANNIIGNGAIRQEGTGSTTLRGSNSTYTGATQVLAGKLRAVNSGFALGSTAGLTSVSPAATLELVSLTSPETVVLKGGTLAAATGAAGLNGALVLTADSILRASSVAPLTLAGPVLAYPGADFTTAGNGRVILANGSNQLNSITVAAGTSLQVGNGNTAGSLGRGALVNNGLLLTNTNNGHLVLGMPISGSGSFAQIRNTVYLTADNTYTGTTLVGGNGSVGEFNQNAELRVGNDTYTGSLGTGAITVQSATNNNSALRYHLNRAAVVANDITLNPSWDSNSQRNATLLRQGLGSITLSGTLTAGLHNFGNELQRATLQSEGGGKLVISGTVNNGVNNSLNITNNGFVEFAGANSNTLWGVLAGGSAWVFNTSGTTTLKGNNTFNTQTYLHRGRVVVDNAAGNGINDDNDFYLLRDSALQFNYSETVGVVFSTKGSLLEILNGSTLTLDDNTVHTQWGRVTGDGSINYSAVGSASFFGLFGPNELTSNPVIGSTTQVTTVRVNSLPDIGAVSPIGAGSTVILGLPGSTQEARFEYVGAGESSNRNFSLNGGAGTVRIAGNGINPLVLSGDISITSTGNKTLMLHGQTVGNTLSGIIDQSTSVLSLTVNPNAGNNDMYGAGWWKLTNAFNNFSGRVTVNVGTLELAGSLGDGAVGNSVLGDLTATRVIDLGTNNFDGRRYDITGGGDNLGGAGGLTSTGTLIFNDPGAGTATLGSNISFTQSYDSTSNPGGGQLVNNGQKVIVINGSLTSGATGNRTWLLDGTNTGTNTINGAISNGSGGAVVSITKEGAGTWRLTGASSYTGGVTITRGTLEIANGSVINDAATVNLSNAGSDGLSVGAATLRVLTTETIGGLVGAVGTGVEISAGQVLRIANANQVYSGVISGGGGLLRTNNDGNARVQTLSNLNTYTGPTVITTNGSSFVGNRFDVTYLADGGQPSGIGAASSAASNLVIDTNTGNGGLRWIGITSQSTDRLFTIGAGAGAANLWADGTTVGDFAPALHFTNTGAIAFLAANTNQTLTLRGSNLGENRFDPKINNNGTGVTSLVKTDPGFWLVTNSNAYTGATTVANGTLAISHGSALGTGTVTVNGAGAGLQLRGGISVANSLANSGSLSGIAAHGGDNTWAGAVTLSGSITSWRVGAIEGSSLSFTNAINGSLGTGRLIKYDRGTLTLGGANTYSGITSLSGGTTVLNYDTGAAGTNASKFHDTSALELGFAGLLSGIITGTGPEPDVAGQSYQPAFSGATLVLSGGNHTEVVAGVTLNNGASRILRQGGASILQMNAITRNVSPGIAAGNGLNDYGTLDFGAAGIATTNTLNSAGGILGGAVAAYATVNKTDWATSAASGTNIAIAALASYTNNSFGSNVNTTITQAATAVPAGATTHTLRFNANHGGTTTLNLAGALNLETGGILITPNVTDNIVLTGGSLQRSANTVGLDTVIHHHGSGTLTIASVIANNTNAQALTKTGAGTVILTAANTFTNRVNIQEGVLQVGDGTTATANARLGLGGSTNNQISMSEGATLRINVANPAFEFNSQVFSGGGTLHLAATNTSTFLSDDDLGNWVGDIVVDGGTLRIRGSANALGSIRGITTINSGGRLDISGVSTTFAERMTLNQGALITVTANGATNSNSTLSGVLTLNTTSSADMVFDVAASQALTLSNIIRTSNGFTKAGNGILTLSANQMQGLLEGAALGVTTPNTNPALLGQVIVSAGEMRLGSTRALGATGLANATVVLSGAALDLRGQALNYADDPDPTREVIRIAGTGINGTGALRNSTGTGALSHLILDGSATISGGGRVADSRLILGTYDINPSTGSSLTGNFTRVRPKIEGNGFDLAIRSNSLLNDSAGAGVTMRDPEFVSALNSIHVGEGVFRIEKEIGPTTGFSGLSSANVTNGIRIGYAGASLADQTNASLGVGPNVGARFNLWNNWDLHHTVNITMDGAFAASNNGYNYIDTGVSSIPSSRTYLDGQITLTGDAARNVFHVDSALTTISVVDQGNLTGSLQSKLIVGGQITGTGGLTKTGFRELRLTNNNTFTGAVNVLRFGTTGVRWQSNTVSVNGVDYQTYGDAESLPEWGLTLSGADARLSGTSAINLQRRGLLVLDNTNRLDPTSGVTGGNHNDRINDNADLLLNHGWLRILGGTTGNSEAIATGAGKAVHSLSGTNIIDLWPTDGAGTNMTLTIGRIQRAPGSVLQFSNLDATSTFGTSNVGESVRIALGSTVGLTAVGAGTGATNRAIMLGVLGGTMPHTYLDDVREFGYNNANVTDYLNQGRNQQFLAASHFMTYDGGYLRPLDDSEYFVPVDGLLDTLNGSAGQNVNLADPFTVVRENVSINALRFGPLADHNGSGGAINAGTTLTSYTPAHNMQLYVDGTLAIESGMISSAYFSAGNSASLVTTIVGGTLDFGSREAIINNQNAIMRVTDGVVATGNLEIRSNIAGSGGLTKTGLAQVVLDGANTYTGVTTISNGTLFLRNGRQALGAGGAGNGVVVEGNGSLNSGNGIQVGSPTSYENVLIKALQGDQQVFRVDNDLTNWFSNITIDNVDAAGQVLFTPRIRTDNSATSIINGNLYGGFTSVSNDIVAIDSRVVQFDTAGNNVFILRGQVGDKADANGNAVPIPDRISMLPTLAGTRTNENEVLRVTLAGASTESNFILERQYNAAGRLTLSNGNALITYDPAAPGNDGTGFWTNTALSRIPNADSNTGTFSVNGGTSQQGFTMGVGALFLTRPGQIFNMAAWNATGNGAKWVGGLNETGTVTYGSATATGVLAISNPASGGTQAAVRLYAASGGTVVVNHRLTGNPGTAPDNIGMMKVGRGTVILQNSTLNAAADVNFDMSGGTLVLDHSGQNVARVGAGHTIFSGGTIHAKSNPTTNSTASITTTGNNTLRLRMGTTEVLADGATAGRTMTVNIGNNGANGNVANLTRAAGAALSLVESTAVGSGIISLQFNNFTNAVLKNRIISWATYGNAPRQALDFAMADVNASNRVKAVTRAPGEYLNDVTAWAHGMDVSEIAGAGFSGTLASSRMLNTLRFDSLADSQFTIASGQTLSLAGDGIAGGLLVSSNTGNSNKTITGGSITAFAASYTGTTTVNTNSISGVSSTANLTVGMPVAGTGIPAGAYITAISGSTITISANATASSSVTLNSTTPELIFHQYGKGTLTIGSTLTGANSVTIAGPATSGIDQIGTTGTVRLTGNNTYTGPTYISGAVLEISSASALGTNPTSVSNGHLSMNGGTLRWTGGVSTLGNRGVTLNGGGGVIEVVSPDGNLVIGDALTGSASVVSQELYRGDLVKTGAGALTFMGDNPSFQGLLDLREGSLILMTDTGDAATGTTTLLGTSRSLADATILRAGTSIQAFLGNGNNSGDWNIDEYFVFEGNNSFTYGGLLDVTATLAGAGVLSGGQINLGSRRPLNLNGVIDVKGTTTFTVVANGILRLNNGSGYLSGSGDIVKDGQGRVEFRANVPDWKGNLVIRQGTVYAANQADVLGTGYQGGKTITLGDAERLGTADLFLHNPDGIQNWIFEVNHDISVTYNPAQTKRLGFDNIGNGNRVSYNGDITLNDNLLVLLQDAGISAGGEQAVLNFNGSFKDGATTGGNLVFQGTDAGGANDNTSGRMVGYAVLNANNSAWTGDVTIGVNTSYDQDKTTVLRFGHAQALTAANDVTMNHNSILQAGGQTVTIGSLTTQGGLGGFYGNAGTMSASANGSSEIIENAAATPGVLTIAQSTPATYEAAWDAFFRDGTLNSQFFAPGANTLNPSASLSLVKAGPGWSTITLDNDYTGSTVVAAGVLQVGRNGVGDTGRATALGTTVNALATIAGTGTVQGNLTALSGANVRPGDMAGQDIGTLTVTGNAIFASGTSALMQVRAPTYNNPDAPTASDPLYTAWRNGVTTDSFSDALDDLVTTAQHDMVNALGTINWGVGTKVTLQNDGYTPRAGDIFHLFRGTGYVGNINVGPALRTGSESGAALDLLLFPLGGNFLWDVSRFNTDGILMVVEAATAPENVAAPVITAGPSRSPASGVFEPGASVTLSVTATGAGPLAYQWFLNGVPVDSVGGRSAVYNFQANTNTKGLYTVAVTNEGGTTLAPTSVLIEVKDLPLIANNNKPFVTASTVNPGGTTTFSVQVSGAAPFQYQWRRDGEDLPGKTGATLVLTNIQEADQGSYSVYITNAAGEATSDGVALNVNDPVSNLVVTRSPSPNAYVGETIVFTASVQGTAPFTYQWRLNGQAISGQTGPTLTLTNAQTALNGSYDVVVDNVVNDSETSAPNVLNLLNPLPVLQNTPVNLTLLTGEPLQLVADALGRPVLKYVWKRNGAVVAGATSATFSADPVLVSQGGTYVCEVSNVAGTASGTVADVVVVDGGIRRLPVALGATATLTANVGANPLTNLTYQWYRVTLVEEEVDDGQGGTETVINEVLEPLVDGGRISGSSEKVLRIAGVLATDDGAYRCEVKGPAENSVVGCEHDVRVFSNPPEFLDFVFEDGLIAADYDFTVPVELTDRSKTPSSITATGLPPGYTIDTVTGRITGKTTKTGSYLVKLTATNAAGSDTAEGLLTVTNLNSTLPGVWVGLFDRAAGLGDNQGGRIELTVTSLATYSGKLFLGTAVYSFKGSLNVNQPQPTATITIPRKGKPLPEPLTLTFTLGADDNLMVSGTVSDGLASADLIAGWRQVWNPKLGAPAARYTGLYTLGLSLPDGSPLIGNDNVPQGAGFASFTVAADGKFKMVGRMADGEAVSVATFVGPNGEMAVFQPMYKALKPGGSLLGLISIDDLDTEVADDNSLLGELDWVRPAGLKPATDRLFKLGFGVAGAPVAAPVEITALGGRYLVPSVGKVVLGMDAAVGVNNASLEFFNAGDLEVPELTSRNPDLNVSVAAGSKVLVLAGTPNPALTKMTANAKTGALAGSFALQDVSPRFPIKPWEIKRSVKFQGVIIREGAGWVGVGYFLLPQLPQNAAGTTDKTSPILSGYFRFDEL